MALRHYCFNDHYMSTVRRPIPIMIDMECYTWQVGMNLLYGLSVGPCVTEVIRLEMLDEEECDHGGLP